MQLSEQNQAGGTSEAQLLEKQAHDFLYQEQFADAYRLFCKAAQRYQSEANHTQAAFCFASAAGCWSRKAGEHLFYNAAVCYEDAAKEARACGDHEYSSLLYRYAALNHERDGEFFNYSFCFYQSKEAYRKFLGLSLIAPQRIHSIAKTAHPASSRHFLKIALSWLALTFSAWLWGHGEKPSRTLAVGLLVIILSAALYMLGFLLKSQNIFHPRAFEALYFSVVTFSTVGYGDIVPVGFSRVVAMFEVLSGLVLMSMFMVGLSRKYLRA